jgi:hypothetical protein
LTPCVHTKNFKGEACHFHLHNNNFQYLHRQVSNVKGAHGLPWAPLLPFRQWPKHMRAMFVKPRKRKAKQ